MSQHAARPPEKEPNIVYRTLLRSRLFRASIWGPDSVSEEDDRLASMLRIWLPLSYATSIAFGLFAYFYGVPAIFDAISPSYGIVWSETVVVASVASLIGVAFPGRLWRLDVYGNALLVMLYGIYSACLLYLAFHVPPLDDRAADRTALAIGSLRLIYLPLWRVFDISRDRVKYHWH